MDWIFITEVVFFSESTSKSGFNILACGTCILFPARLADLVLKLNGNRHSACIFFLCYEGQSRGFVRLPSTPQLCETEGER
jgi:hypothetical protein